MLCPTVISVVYEDEMKYKLICTLMAFVAAVFLTVAFGHAELNAIMPKDGSIIRQWPKEIVLEFSEPLETSISRFKLYRLSAAKTIKAAQAEAETLAPTVINLKNDGDKRADLGLSQTSGAAARVKLVLKPKQPAGFYAVIWRLTSTDTHTSTGTAVFWYKP
jgi:methionine-rich copper-binding protein CopC